MARFKGIDIPSNKRVEIGLTYIHGIGRSLSGTILKDAGVDKDKKVYDLTPEDEAKIREQLDKYLLEGDLRREVGMNIKTKMEIGSYQGIRHKKGLPVRGQSTRSNARTRKGRGKTVANKKK
ncbi:MAG: 30S ribosomal protein S13 [Bacilli bacterium]|nr:30S ribosomal protein S13 [Bacilli bacterium]